MTAAVDAWLDRWRFKYPHATDDYVRDGQWPQPRAEALTRRYIAARTPSIRLGLVLDVDDDQAQWAARNADLPDPTVMTINPATEHAHLWWLLESPVYTLQAARQGPLRLYDRVNQGLIASVVGADQGYAQQLTQNPIHPHWTTVWGPSDPYSLKGLAKALGDRFPAPPDYGRKTQVRTETGRNVELFDRTREWAYREIRKQNYPSITVWRQMVTDFTALTNFTLDANDGIGPMSRAEAEQIGKSVAHWTHRTFTAAEFSKIQARRGKVSSSAKTEAVRKNATAPRPKLKKVDRSALFAAAEGTD
ncbi:replication initiation protein [Rhodococcus opacus]|uniref:Replication protein RepA n=1 Tax=Rhodococcus opacus (strain B4) TaxID=632772 RepID=Q564M9_RHOOB|nr:replication initiation protein [Rhodococcus opacus]BAD95583.1 replication protein RepA [Rhodococcus opacus B4]